MSQSVYNVASYIEPQNYCGGPQAVYKENTEESIIYLQTSFTQGHFGHFVESLKPTQNITMEFSDSAFLHWIPLLKPCSLPSSPSRQLWGLLFHLSFSSSQGAIHIAGKWVQEVKELTWVHTIKGRARISRQVHLHSSVHEWGDRAGVRTVSTGTAEMPVLPPW